MLYSLVLIVPVCIYMCVDIQGSSCSIVIIGTLFIYSAYINVGVTVVYVVHIFVVLFFFLSNATTCPCGLRGPPSWAWQECNRLLRLGRP